MANAIIEGNQGESFELAAEETQEAENQEEATSEQVTIEEVVAETEETAE